MKQECINIVNLKYNIDLELQKMVDDQKLSIGGSKASIMPLRFLFEILPFWTDHVYERIKNFKIPSPLVIGGTYNDYSDVTVSKKYLEWINDNADRGNDVPSYHKIGEMPLYVAGEGKNRVKEFSKYNMDISCTVKLTEYPKAHELEIHPVKFKKNLFFVSCSNSQFFRNDENMVQIRYPNVVVPFLKKYGVQMGKPIFKLFSSPLEKRSLIKFSNNIMSA